MQVGHAGSEHHESASTWQRGSGSEQTAEPGGASLVGNGLGEGVVVTDKVGLGDAQCGDHGRRREVQNLEVMDVCRADPAEHLEGVYAAVEEVAEQLSPRCLPWSDAYHTPGPPWRWYRPSLRAGSENASSARDGEP